MIIYFIDGNNLFGAEKSTAKEKSNLSTGVREKLGFKLERFFFDKNAKVILFYDGFEKDKLKLKKIDVKYSNRREADFFIRQEISTARNPKLVTVITSDRALAEFAKKCSCKVLSSEQFLGELNSKKARNEEVIIKSLANSNQEFLEMFEKGREEN